MRREKDDIDQVLQGILTKVMETASENNVITPQENRIIESVRQSLNVMQLQLYEILNSNLSEEEFHEIANEIIHNELQNAIKDLEQTKLSKEEQQLILCIKEIIEDEV